MHPSFIDIVMLTKHKPLVTGIDNDCVLHQVFLFQVVKKSFHIVIYALHTSHITL